MMFFRRTHHNSPTVVSPDATLTHVRQIMARILRRGIDSVQATDSFASLTGGSSVDPEKCHFDDNLLDLCALEVAIKDEFQLDVSEEENETLFRPGTTAQMFADYINHHHSRS